MSALCFTCHSEPAGYPGNPLSAYCHDCQPADARAVHGSANGCGACGEQFGGIVLFDAHQEHYPDGHPLKGVFSGHCTDPATMNLVQNQHGVWLTLAENSRRLNAARGILSHD